MRSKKASSKEASSVLSQKSEVKSKVSRENTGRGSSLKGAFVLMVNGAGLPLILEAAICFSSKLRRQVPIARSAVSPGGCSQSAQDLFAQAWLTTTPKSKQFFPTTEHPRQETPKSSRILEYHE